jgi:hypothetical protein
MSHGTVGVTERKKAETSHHEAPTPQSTDVTRPANSLLMYVTYHPKAAPSPSTFTCFWPVFFTVAVLLGSATYQHAHVSVGDCPNGGAG